MTRSTIIAVAALAMILVAANYTIWQRQAVVDSGRPILLELRPVDPRSLLQGDYMVLRYHERLFPPAGVREALPRTGAFVVSLDTDNVAAYERIDDGSPLAVNEARLKYKLRDERGRIRLGAETFFFQEGHGPIFNEGRFGVLHVAEDGTSVLIGLADENRVLIAPREPGEN